MEIEVERLGATARALDEAPAAYVHDAVLANAAAQEACSRP